MKTKFKDYLLYSLACIGVVSLFISATNQPQQTTSTVPESHVWKMINVYGETMTGSWAYMWNAKTGEAYQLKGDKKSKVL